MVKLWRACSGANPNPSNVIDILFRKTMLPDVFTWHLVCMIATNYPDFLQRISMVIQKGQPQSHAKRHQRNLDILFAPWMEMWKICQFFDAFCQGIDFFSSPSLCWQAYWFRILFTPLIGQQNCFSDLIVLWDQKNQKKASLEWN